jgi:predicted membrane chloride channel (bestrophin family)
VSTLVPEFSHEAVIQVIQTTSFVLALLLALRMNRTYERWWDAWRAFRRIGDCAAALTQQAVVFAEGDPPLQAEVARWAVLWCYSVVMFCSGAPELDPMAARLLSEREAAAFNAVPNKFNFVELKLRKLLARVKATVDQGLSIDAHMREGWQCVRTCSTIKQTALPYALTLMCTGFIEIELVLLPIGLIGSPYSISADNFTRSQRATGIMLLLGLYMIINLLLLGADEVASQMEDPFLVLPLNDRTEGVVDLIRRCVACCEWGGGAAALIAAHMALCVQAADTTKTSQTTTNHNTNQTHTKPKPKPPTQTQTQHV